MRFGLLSSPYFHRIDIDPICYLHVVNTSISFNHCGAKQLRQLIDWLSLDSINCYPISSRCDYM